MSEAHLNDQRLDAAARRLQFRDPQRARALGRRIREVAEEIEAPTVTVMHVCGSHEQAIARFGLRSLLPEKVEVLMGPGCPVCVTDSPEVDEAVALALQGVHVATYGDMLRVPGSSRSLADAQAEGGKVHVVYSIAQAVTLARGLPASEELVFFASGFETTAVTTAAAILARDEELPANFSVLAAHKYIPPAMDLVAQMPGSRIDGYLAAGHAATITGWEVFEPVVERQGVPVVVAGFEPLDILAALLRVLELIRDGEATVENLYPRCVTREGNRNAQEQLWRVFRTSGGVWRGIAEIPSGNLILRDEWAPVDARTRFTIDLPALWARKVPGEAAGRASGEAARELAAQCICGDIMAGIAAPTDCPLFGQQCRPDSPVGACMVSSEGTCKIWQLYGGRPQVGAA
ncbi:MAG: hydrogenase formation protein HypD [Acidobacteriota bacterium]|nr:hydrogenase formation protein HypD [Acidobacteriota bacterium]